jgi:hypothetical protein
LLYAVLTDRFQNIFERLIEGFLRFRYFKDGVENDVAVVPDSIVVALEDKSI